MIYKYFITIALSVALSATASTQASKKNQYKSPPPKPIMGDRNRINTDDTLTDLNIAPPRSLQLLNSNEVAFEPAAAYLGKINNLQKYLSSAQAAKLKTNPQIINESNDPNSENAPSITDKWYQMLRNSQYLAPNAQIEAVQNFINRTPYRHDSDTNNVGDSWKSPEDFLNSGGDSEDFAIAKYISLRLLGVDTSRIRIAVVFDSSRNIYRAVTVLYGNNNCLILNEDRNEIISDQDTTNISPVYSFNEKTIWYHWQNGETPPTQFLQTDVQRTYKLFP